MTLDWTEKPTYTGNDCDNCGRNRVEHSCWDDHGREICEKCWKVQGSDEYTNPDARNDLDWLSTAHKLEG